MNNFDIKKYPGQQEINLRELWLIALRKKWIIICISLSVLVLATLYSFLATPIYTAEGQLLIDREPNILSFEEIFKIDSFNNDYFQTQYKLLQSRALAGKTIERMRLNKDEAFLKTEIGDMGVEADDLENDPNIRTSLINSFLGRLTIRPVRNSRLVQASFSDRDPEFAAAALNSLFDAYIEMNIQRKFQASEQATDFLTNQIEMVQEEIEQSEKELQEYGKEKDIIALSSTENTVIEKLGELNKALTDAQIDRVNKETYYNEIVLATPDFIPDALANPLIRDLREEYNRLNREYVKRSETFYPDHPDMLSLKSELDTAKKALEDETQALIKRAYSDFQAALKKERALSGEFNNQKREAFQLNSNAIQYNSLLIQIQNQKNLLESLMKRKSETDVTSRLGALRTSNIWIVDKAEVPSIPSSPNKRNNMMLGLMIGLLGGLGLAFLSERLDHSVRNADDIKMFTGMSTLGVVPDFFRNGIRGGYLKAYGDENSGTAIKSKDVQKSVDLIVHFSPKSFLSEYYRSIRTNVLHSEKNAKVKALAVMSPLPREGKTATISNLAATLAHADKKVVIIDADLRKPRLHKIFGTQNVKGLTNYLDSDLAMSELLKTTPIHGLFLINAGPVPPNPVDLLGREKMTNLIDWLRENFDFILLDTPPMLAVSDSIVLGPQLDGAILVVRSRKTPREALIQASEKLDEHRIKGMGVVINQSQMRDSNYYFTDYYYAYHRQT